MQKCLNLFLLLFSAVIKANAHTKSPRAQLPLPAFVHPKGSSSSLYFPNQKFNFNFNLLQQTSSASPLQDTAAPPQAHFNPFSSTKKLNKTFPAVQTARLHDFTTLKATPKPAAAAPLNANTNANTSTPPFSSLTTPESSLSTGSMRGNLHSRRESVSPVVAQMLYEDMLLGRYVEDACARLYYRGKTAGFVHLYTGPEAVSTGILKLLRKEDAVVSTYRDHVHATSKGVTAREVFSELFGKQTGCSKGFGGSMHLFSKPFNLFGGFAFIGEQIPVALGVAFSQMYRKVTQTNLPGDKDLVGVDEYGFLF